MFTKSFRRFSVTEQRVGSGKLCAPYSRPGQQRDDTSVHAGILVGLCLVVALAGVPSSRAQPWEKPPQVLPGTQPLTWSDPLDVRLMDGAHRYIERKIAESSQGRADLWKRDCSSSEAYARSVAENRKRFRKVFPE